MENWMRLWFGEVTVPDRQKNDAENGYQWNIGSWNNIFLNAYWKGDDPENIGKVLRAILV